MNEAHAIGDRLREARKRSGLTQRELARLSGLSVSLVRKLEQGDYGDVRLETVHRLAVVLRVPTSALAGGDAPVPDQDSVARWEPVRRALEEPPGTEPSEEPTLTGVRETFGTLVPLLLAGRFAEMGALLPERPPIALRLLATGKSLVVEVWDRSPLDLEPREADPGDECGRGLTVVAALADRRGWERTTANRKVVWAELARERP